MDIIFLPRGFFYLSFFFSSPNLCGRRVDVYHTRHSYPAVWITVMRCFTASVTVCSGVCSRSRMRRHAFWRELVDATTSHQFSIACTGFWWNSGSTTSWPLSSTSHCEVKLYRIWSMTASWLRTPDAPQLRSAYANVLTVPRTNTRLGDRSFSAMGPRIWNSLPASLRQPDIEFGQFKPLLKAFLFCETAAH